MPFVRRLTFTLDNIIPVRAIHNFDGEHYWEINKKITNLKKLLTFLQKRAFCLKKPGLTRIGHIIASLFSKNKI